MRGSRREAGGPESAPVVIMRAGSDPGGGRDLTVVDRATGMPAHAIAVVSFGGDLAGVGIVAKGAAVAKVRSRFEISGLQMIEPRLPLDELLAAMPNRFRRHVDHRALPARTSSEVLSALLRLRPRLRKPVARFQDQVRSRSAQMAAAEERDAVAVGAFGDWELTWRTAGLVAEGTRQE
jgi:hypothetical protein